MFVCCGWSCGFNMSLLLKKCFIYIYSQTIRTGCIGNSYGYTCGCDIFLVCPLAVPQVMSMQRTTCCLLLRLSRTTQPGKTNISGCCSSEARSCARWEWCITIVMPLKRAIPGFMLSNTWNKGLSVAYSVRADSTLECMPPSRFPFFQAQSSPSVI